VARLPGGGAWVSTSCCMQAGTRTPETNSAKILILMPRKVAFRGVYGNLRRRRSGAFHPAQKRRAGAASPSPRPQAHAVERPPGTGGMQG
jgi:hypothetical protein